MEGCYVEMDAGVFERHAGERRTLGWRVGGGVLRRDGRRGVRETCWGEMNPRREVGGRGGGGGGGNVAMDARVLGRNMNAGVKVGMEAESEMDAGGGGG